MTKLPDYIATAQQEEEGRENFGALIFLAGKINDATLRLIDDARKDDVNWMARVRLNLHHIGRIAELACGLRHGSLDNASAREIYRAFEVKAGPTLEELAEA